jgi:hypothetical protein
VLANNGKLNLDEISADCSPDAANEEISAAPETKAVFISNETSIICFPLTPKPHQLDSESWLYKLWNSQ